MLRGASNDNKVFLFESRADFDAFQKSVVAKDSVGTNQALANATVIFQGAHARALEADASHGAIRVRVTDGVSEDFAGWTTEASLQRE